MSHRAAMYEPGTIQKNCFEVDLEATTRAYERHRVERPSQLEADVKHLQRGGYVGLLADVPALAIEAAHRVGIPSAAIWNFTWDWILEPILVPSVGAGPELSDLVHELRAAYGLAGLHLKLPFSPRDTHLSRVEPAPLIGRRSMAPREVTLPKLGLSPSDARPVVLVAMGGWTCGDWPAIAVEGCKDFRFVVVGDVPIEVNATTRRIPTALEPGYTFFDLVRAADVVLSKPGYGIASECIVNRTPLLGVERRDFREIPELLRDIQDLGPFRELSLQDFFRGRWEDSLHSLLEHPKPWKPIEMNGAQKVAERLCAFFDL